MKDFRIIIRPFALLNLLECKMTKQVNEHAVARFTGHIQEELGDQYVKMSLEERIWGEIAIVNALEKADVEEILKKMEDKKMIEKHRTPEILSLLEENDVPHGAAMLALMNEHHFIKEDRLKEAAAITDKEEIIFKGVLTSFEVATENGVKIVRGELRSGTFLMDTTPHIRTFQAYAMPYETVLETITAPHKGHFIMTVGLDDAIDTLIVQYKETDWDFARRLASHFGSVVVPESTKEGVLYFFGLPEWAEPVHLDTNMMKMRNSTEEYLEKKDGGLNVAAHDATYYIVTLREIHELGACIIFQNWKLYVYRAESELRGSELYHTYYLKTKTGFLMPRAYNEKICGVSLESKVLKVENIVVEASALLDENKDGAGVRKFIYESIYSSPDGTGWYVMPEPGDHIRLYFPSNDEREGFAKSSIHLGYDAKGFRTDPDRKSMMTKYGKEIVFSPGALVLTNNKGMSIRIVDSQGIQIVSDKAIEITAKNEVYLESKESSITLTAPDSVTFKQGQTSIQLKDSIIIDGAKTKIQ